MKSVLSVLSGSSLSSTPKLFFTSLIRISLVRNLGSWRNITREIGGESSSFFPKIRLIQDQSPMMHPPAIACSFQRVWQGGKDTLPVTQIKPRQRLKIPEYFANPS